MVRPQHAPMDPHQSETWIAPRLRVLDKVEADPENPTRVRMVLLQPDKDKMDAVAADVEAGVRSLREFAAMDQHPTLPGMEQHLSV